MKNRWKSRLFRKMVLSYFAILFVPIAVFCTLFVTQMWKENRQWEEGIYADGFSSVSSAVNREFFDITNLGDRLLLTNHMLKSGEPVFLDDVTVDDVQNALQIKVSIVESSGADFVSSLIED